MVMEPVAPTARSARISYAAMTASLGSARVTVRVSDPSSPQNRRCAGVDSARSDREARRSYAEPLTGLLPRDAAFFVPPRPAGRGGWAKALRVGAAAVLPGSPESGIDFGRAEGPGDAPPGTASAGDRSRDRHASEEGLEADSRRGASRRLRFGFRMVAWTIRSGVLAWIEA